MNDEINQALRRLERKGRLTAEQVVEAARDSASPLHAHFTWDDSQAAHQYRLEQARGLIRSVRVEFVRDSTVVRSVAYIQDPVTDRGYVSVSVLTKADEQRNALETEMKRITSLLVRARELADTLGLDGEIDGMIQCAVMASRIMRTEAAE